MLHLYSKTRCIRHLQDNEMKVNMYLKSINLAVWFDKANRVKNFFVKLKKKLFINET